MGAWIETTFDNRLRKEINKVAPLVGAWIETLKAGAPALVWESHPSWVRGLKHSSHKGQTMEQTVAPLVGAWIETKTVCWLSVRLRSHPSWVRGLKQFVTL